MKKLFKQGMVIFLLSLSIAGFSNDTLKSTQGIGITNKGQLLDTNINSPVIKKVNDNVYLNIVGKDNTNVIIEIYYQGYDLAYKEKHSKVSSLWRTYDFSTSKKGNYTFYIKVGKETHKEIINIK